MAKSRFTCMWRAFLYILTCAFFYLLFNISVVNAIGPDPSKPYIQIMPFLSTQTISNGYDLHVTAMIQTNYPITQGRFVIDDLNETVNMKLNSGTLKKGVWTGTWKAHSLLDKNYRVSVTFFDNTGHTWTERGLSFSDPISGNDILGEIDHTENIGFYGNIINFPHDIKNINSVNFYSYRPNTNVKISLYNSKYQKIWQSIELKTPDKNGWINIPIESGFPHKISNIKKGNYYLIFSQKKNTLPILGSIKNSEYNVLGIESSKTKPTNKSWSAYIIYDEVKPFSFFSKYRKVDQKTSLMYR